MVSSLSNRVKPTTTPASPQKASRTNQHQQSARVISRFRLSDIEAAGTGLCLALGLGKCSVANGAFTQYYASVLDDGSEVLIKRAWRGDRYWEGQLALENERKILCACRSKYFLNLVGVSDDTPEHALVLESAAYGNLHDLLHNVETVESMTRHSVDASVQRKDANTDALSWPARIQIAYHIACALKGLHGSKSKVAHRDVRSSNIWIHNGFSAKLGGFDFATTVKSCGPRIPCPLKCMSYLDPDYHSEEHLFMKCDVFCFGVLLLEIISGRKVMDVNNHPPFIVDWALPLIHKDKAIQLCDPKMKPPYQHLKVILDIARLAALCVNPVSLRRPKISDLSDELKVISLRLPVSVDDSMRGRLNMKDLAQALRSVKTPDLLPRSHETVTSTPQMITPRIINPGVSLKLPKVVLNNDHKLSKSNDSASFPELKCFKKQNIVTDPIKPNITVPTVMNTFSNGLKNKPPKKQTATAAIAGDIMSAASQTFNRKKNPLYGLVPASALLPEKNLRIFEQDMFRKSLQPFLPPHMTRNFPATALHATEASR